MVLTVGVIWGGLGPAWWAALVSTALHTAYAAVLQRAYSAADLSVVYPVSRGLAPVLVTVMAAPWNGGTSVMQVAALAAVLAGVVLASGATWRNLTRARGPVSYTHLRAHETSLHLVCRLLLEKTH